MRDISFTFFDHPFAPLDIEPLAHDNEARYFQEGVGNSSQRFRSENDFHSEYIGSNEKAHEGLFYISLLPFNSVQKR